MPTSIFLIHFVGIAVACVRMLIGAFSVIYLLGKGVTLTDVGLLKSFQAVVIVFIDIPLSYISDRYSRKFSISLSILCSAIWLILTGLSQDFTGFLMAELFNALSLGLMSGTFSAYLYDASQREKPGAKAAKILASYQKNQFFFMGIFSLFGVFLYDLNETIAWFVAGSLMLGIWVVSFLLPKDDGAEQPLPLSLKHFFSGISKLLDRNSGIKKSLVLLVLGYGLFLQSLIQFWQPLVTYSPSFISHSTSLGFVFFAILMAQAFSGKVVQMLHGSESLERIALVSIVIAVVLMLSSMRYSFLSALYLIVSFFSLSLLSSLGTSAIIQDSPSNFRSTYLSTLSTLGKLLMLITMPLVAFSVEIGGFWIFSGIMAICAWSLRILFARANAAEEITQVQEQ
ncbi:permease, major facilitator superfamily protein [Pseudomonas orientalis]|uniref:MFS transporter n=1 Tax=Pseudomonas orientalis TaxID=76758 RepID=UPI000F6B3E92|nr:MFS transporter [Pseudomonas orientalis]AZE84832.1 permease, major facilitator superfamily protein [Pseudomonas orientalis]